MNQPITLKLKETTNTLRDAYPWWQTGIVYQIYPRSYQDSNGDGIGDLNGIRERLDYLQSLNIDAVWLSPIYPSPMHDFGYDVSNYVDVHPMFGSLDDFDALLTAVHDRGMKLILDLVPNHTSDEHPWFIASRSSRDNPKREWYIWADPAADGSPPNNWTSFFGGPAWTFDESTGQYYLHQFVTQQPELNYRHPDVLSAMLNQMRFWLDKGVDGFRVDVIWLMMKDPALRDEPINADWDGVNPMAKLDHIYTQNLPEVHDLIRAMRQLLDEYDERVMIGEIYLPFDQLAMYYGRSRDECHLPFNFHLITLKEWTATAVRQLIEAYEASLPDGAWPNWVLGNHDQHRIATRVGQAQARIANMLLLTLRGTPTTYYGEEIGMENVTIPPELVMDPPAVNQPEIAHIVGRDPARTPMQWDDSTQAGFSDAATTWLPIAADYASRNVANEAEDATSMLSLYWALTSIRRTEPALFHGDYATVATDNDAVLAYRRSSDNGDDFLIMLNFSNAPQWAQAEIEQENGRIEIATDMRRSGQIALESVGLAANEGLVIRLLPNDEEETA